MTYKIFSFYNRFVNPRVPMYQRAVFKHFGYEIAHIVNEAFSHGDFLNHICRTVQDTDYLIFFDIDCIPLRKDWLKLLLHDLQEPHTIAGAAQTANHLRNAQNLYISPFFFGVSTAYLRQLGYPDMRMKGDMDAGQNLTEQIIKNGGQVKYWWPTHIEEEQWYLHHPEHNKFGLGTTYNDAVYHAFFSRVDLSDRFIRKCNGVLPWYTRWALRTRQRKWQPPEGHPW
ncbi:hypothetical protein F0L74_27285 [Chitinophaga agrisoli]|uniref:Glycosyl transferase family 2 n=1 Tax=Chitinophaga agrisoli TaxID=2607653 RepID=A0A5B2VJW8_9BACT|nr:hypothetical protein [Chitinophaga agrisoli]KAA2239893.1 hypothetical protein F0L74_27285 [Chitinophaga agrisoli]